MSEDLKSSGQYSTHIPKLCMFMQKFMHTINTILTTNNCIITVGFKNVNICEILGFSVLGYQFWSHDC